MNLMFPFAYVVLSVLAWSARTSPAPVVGLGYAKYEGVFNETLKTTRFLGIRYAAPPTGTLRWQPPQPPSATSGVQKANTDPPSCMVTGIGNSTSSPFPNELEKRDPVQSEDCLFLNVYTPGNLSSTDKLPVVVWIHGGGYVLGSAYAFDGSDLISEANGGVVTVMIQYRLGLFGFLSGKEVKKHGALNAGLLDQQFALQWVQEHIHKFNGDPARVTIWGESAGAGSVLQHIVANGGKTSPPLFRAGITSSVFLPSQYGYSDRIPESLYSEVVSQSNCSSASHTLNCLRKVDLATLEAINVNLENNGFFGTFLWVPVVDGEFIQERPTEALQQNKINGDIILSVTNTFEGTIFVDPQTSPNVNVTNYVAQLFPTLNAKQLAAAAAQYKDLGSPLFQVIAIMGESIFICPTYFLLRAFGDRGYKSEFAIPPAHHADDLGYYFPTFVSLIKSDIIQPPRFKNRAFIKAFSQSFVDFARSLNPNDKSSPTITPRWGKWKGKTEMLFNRTEGSQPDIREITTSNALLRRCDFWQSVSSATSQ